MYRHKDGWINRWTNIQMGRETAKLKLNTLMDMFVDGQTEGQNDRQTSDRLTNSQTD